jgi:hypothetical protein
VLVAVRGRLEWSHRIKAQHGKGPGRWNCPENLGWNVLLLGEELATLALSNQVLSIDQSSGPVEARPVGFSHRVCGGCVVAALPAMDLL